MLTKKTNRRQTAKMIATAGLFATAVPNAVRAHDHNMTATPGADHASGTGTSAAYMAITNHGETSDTLVSGSADICEVVEIHNMEMDGDVMKMIELEDGLEIPPGDTVMLESGGYHIMLINLTQDLHPEDTFMLQLEFESAGTVELQIEVGASGTDAEPVKIGDIEISEAFARPAPMLGGHDGTPVATPTTH